MSRIKRFFSGRTGLVLLVVAAFVLGMFLRGGSESAPAGHAHADANEPTVWTCSMHPQIQLTEPGQCPICFMDLIPVDDGGDEDLGPRTLEMSEAAAALAEIRTEPVRGEVATRRVKLVGKVTADETRVRTIAAWVAGRIDTLFVDFTGITVERGQKLVSLYSPDLYAAQVEMFSAIEAQRELQSSGQEDMSRTATATVTAARERLHLWGLASEQIAAIEARGEPAHHVTIRAPVGGVVLHKNAVEGMYVGTGTPLYTVADLSRVWVDLDAYESDLPWLQEGQELAFQVEALPGRRFTGTTVFMNPILDEAKRTVTVRVEAENPDRLLKPGMLVGAEVNATLDTDGDPSLVIPSSAPLITGRRAVVYVRLPGREKPAFEGREVVLGPRAGDRYVVAAGLAEGERVVVNGAFKIDSALQIQAKPSMMNPAPAAIANDAGTDPTYAVPDAFGDQLTVFLEAYLALQKALAADDNTTAATATGRAAEALAAVDMTLIEGEVHQAWMRDLTVLRTSLEAIRQASDIAKRRERFLPLSEGLWRALRRYEYRGERPVRLFHCPMASDNRGADWLQVDTATANPYYGAMMLRCGSQTDSIPAGTGGR